jgi:hypothetical protein
MLLLISTAQIAVRQIPARRRRWLVLRAEARERRDDRLMLDAPDVFMMNPVPAAGQVATDRARPGCRYSIQIVVRHKSR